MSNDISKILVPVDGSPHALKAAELASDLAVSPDAEIIRLHALLSNEMPAGLKRALEVELAERVPGYDNLVTIPVQIMARVDDGKLQRRGLVPRKGCAQGRNTCRRGPRRRGHY